MSDPETEAIRALECLFLQSGVQGGQLFLFYFPFAHSLPVEDVLTQFEFRMNSRFPHQEISFRRCVGQRCLAMNPLTFYPRTPQVGSKSTGDRPVPQRPLPLIRSTLTLRDMLDT